MVSASLRRASSAAASASRCVSTSRVSAATLSYRPATSCSFWLSSASSMPTSGPRGDTPRLSTSAAFSISELSSCSLAALYAAASLRSCSSWRRRSSACLCRCFSFSNSSAWCRDRSRSSVACRPAMRTSASWRSRASACGEPGESAAEAATLPTPTPPLGEPGPPRAGRARGDCGGDMRDRKSRGAAVAVGATWPGGGMCAAELSRERRRCWMRALSSSVSLLRLAYGCAEEGSAAPGRGERDGARQGALLLLPSGGLSVALPCIFFCSLLGRLCSRFPFSDPRLLEWSSGCTGAVPMKYRYCSF
eukprot:Rhum_TRINITY_DN6328_c0_g1::Rhum_TRINITY_DN6328_c0_g1_i1::g.19778::m.19778